MASYQRVTRAVSNDHEGSYYYNINFVYSVGFYINYHSLYLITLSYEPILEYKSPNSVRHQIASGKRACNAQTKQDRFKLITHTNRWPWAYYPAKTWIGQVASSPSSDNLKKTTEFFDFHQNIPIPVLPNYTARAN